MPRRSLITGAAALAACVAVATPAAAREVTVGPADQVTATLRQLRPYGAIVRLGNFPGGATLSANGRWLWTVSAGWSQNDIRIVDLRRHRVVQTLQIPGASGGVALDDLRHRAYVSGEPDSTNADVVMPPGAPGRAGDVVHVLGWSPTTGHAHEDGVIPIPAPSDAPPLDGFPPPTPPERRSWPERIAVSPDGSTLLVALGLADRAAIVDTATTAVRYVATGSHPFGAAILPDGRTGLISNRGPGTVSVIDLRTGAKVKDIEAGPHLSHPESIAIDPAGTRAFVPLANDDAVAVIDLRRLELVRTLIMPVPQGPGGAPVDAAVTPDGRELLVARSAADDIAVFALPAGARPAGAPWSLLGRIPTADYPTGVEVAGQPCDHRHPPPCGTLAWVAAKGFGLGPNAGPPFTSQYFDIPTNLNTKGLVTGQAGIAPLPRPSRLERLSAAADAQLRPINTRNAPADTPLRPDGPIKHVFYVVRENRTYDQVLGDDRRGDGEPSYAIFGQGVTPNAHALARHFPLLDRFYADSEASIDGHYWTAAATASDYVHRTWRQNYAGRGYPSDAWFFQIAAPQTGFIFDRADEQSVSWANLGEAAVHLAPLPDRDRTASDDADVLRRFSKSDLGPAVTPGGCYDPFIGASDLLGGVPSFDSSKPAGAPAGSVSRLDCFRLKLSAWEASDSLPRLVYLTLPNDHTNGAQPGRYSPRAMVADNDLALGQVVDLVSHSKYWKESAIFVVEDDSQDGFDHQDAHRIPAFVISPYAKSGAVVHTPYDMVSMVKSLETILGLGALNLYDAAATPMYDAFTAQPVNDRPFDALAPTYDLLERNPAQPNSAAARAAARRDTTIPDHISQRLLDRVLWKSVHGPRSEPPRPGPNADPEEDEG
jgi:DNA-binding beta-propeller fold protein YncE